MADIDFAIHGSSVLGDLLAGLLARDHGRRVVRVGRRPSAQRLPRSVHLALPMSVHPRNWQLVRQCESETRGLLASIGADDCYLTGEVSIHADTDATLAALDHSAHVAHAYGHQVRRIDRGWAIRYAASLRTERLEDRLALWLQSLQVQSKDEGAPEASVTVLADDSAILERLDEQHRPAILRSQAMMATLVVSSRPLMAPIQRFPDRGIILAARPGKTILALVAGDADPEIRLGATLSGPFPMKRLATTRFRRLVATDGAPVAGPLKAQKVFVVAGFGDLAAFMAPALARCLTGQSSEDERSWFLAHDPSRSGDDLIEFAA